ncbi:hypothetical protein ABD91_20825 [Lysinibacillus sphaericus]|uniref:hypothetical protein n=1 Tax=Lysinibacillus sphaericus TaxID=1421 RepID=UPI0018CD0F1C|nr:hypothetical protein [Lysinibacillus sphaericus]MBG9693187.1 hypothetical protein [Lysinibacillus sphaericus]
MEAYNLQEVDALIRAGVEVKVVATKNVDNKGNRLIQKGDFYLITCDDKGIVYKFENITDLSNIFTACQYTTGTTENLDNLNAFISSSMLRYENQIVQCIMNESMQVDKNSVEALKQIEGINIVYTSRFETAFEVETRLLPKAVAAVNELTAEEIYQGQKSIASLDIGIDFSMYDFYHKVG